jgi:hypothetical protein
MLILCFWHLFLYKVYDLFGLTKSAQCFCFTLWCVGITKNTRGNLFEVKSGLSRNLSQNVFRRWSLYESKTASNGKLPNYKVVGNFARNILDIKFNWFQVQTAEISPIHCNARWGDRNPRSYIMGGNLTRGGLLHPQIADAKSHDFASPWIPSPWGRATKKPWRKGLRGGSPPWCRW